MANKVEVKRVERQPRIRPQGRTEKVLHYVPAMERECPTCGASLAGKWFKTHCHDCWLAWFEAFGKHQGGQPPILMNYNKPSQPKTWLDQDLQVLATKLAQTEIERVA